MAQGGWGVKGGERESERERDPSEAELVHTLSSGVQGLTGRSQTLRVTSPVSHFSVRGEESAGGLTFFFLEPCPMRKLFGGAPVRRAKTWFWCTSTRDVMYSCS